MWELLGLDADDSGRMAIQDLDGSASWTYGELERLACLYSTKFAQCLSSAAPDNPPGLLLPRVAFLVDPGAEYVACTLACWRAGCIAFPLATMHPARELTHYLEDSACDLIGKLCVRESAHACVRACRSACVCHAMLRQRHRACCCGRTRAGCWGERGFAASDSLRLLLGTSQSCRPAIKTVLKKRWPAPHFRPQLPAQRASSASTMQGW